MKKGGHQPGKVKFWRRHIKRWELSGLLQKEYCAKHQLHLKSFGYWKRILGQLAQAAQLPSQEPNPNQPSLLIPLSIVPDIASGSSQSPSRAGIQLQANGYTIDLAVGFHTGTLRALLEALA